MTRRSEGLRSEGRRSEQRGHARRRRARLSGLLSVLGFICGIGLAGGPEPAHAAVTARPTVTAHPLGDFSVNRYNGLVVAPHEVRIDHVEDLAEIPTAQVKADLTRTGPAVWAARRCTETARAMRISIDGRQREPRVRSARADLRPGQAGLNTLRVECSVAAAGSGSSVTFRDGGQQGSAGWREITARADRMTLTSADVPGNSRSTRLTRFPADLLSSPPDQSTATLRVRPGGPALADRQEAGVARPAPSPGIDPLTGSFSALVARHRLTPAFASLALLIAVALGALHALAPGHGKTIMAAHAVTRAGDRGTGGDEGRPDRNRRARIRREVLTLGLTVTITHTAGVLVLGLLIVSGSLAAPAGVYPWLGVASGVLIVMAGTALLRRARRSAPSRTPSHGPGHGHGHGHAYGHGHGHAHGEGHAHGHVRVRMPRRGEAVLMGFGGGLVPSPSAVLVLVGAAAIGQAWFGVVLVLAYGIGLASSLVLIGLLVVGSGRSLARRLGSIAETRAGGPRCLHRLVPLLLTERVRHLVPMGAAGAVLTVGAGLVLRNLLAAFA